MATMGVYVIQTLPWSAIQKRVSNSYIVSLRVKGLYQNGWIRAISGQIKPSKERIHRSKLDPLD